MKKCKWCNSNIEDTAVICPYCKANQNSEQFFVINRFPSGIIAS